MQDIRQHFPVTLDSNWSDPTQTFLPDHLKSWLLDNDSLTARLKSHCQQFSIDVLGQQVQFCTEQEANEFIQPNEQVLVREVVLYCDDNPQVFARSLLPLASLTGEQQHLASLGDQSLGQVIFNSPNLKRGPISISSFASSSRVANLSKELALPVVEPIWGRRSMFFIENKPLSVAEVFLPKAIAYQQVEKTL